MLLNSKVICFPSDVPVKVAPRQRKAPSSRSTLKFYRFRVRWLDTAFGISGEALFGLSSQIRLPVHVSFSASPSWHIVVLESPVSNSEPNCVVV